ncbi:FAD-dependent monooxygenase yanF [Apiospora hydei]|uniref:FAD-dependent monooxygenase yanF n=1 Tax=Apiospora hydei TaxID=1337664 RepID=A0ABR1VYK5_9PEZI
MRLTSFFAASLGGLVVAKRSASAFEPEGFNVKEALQGLDINVDQIPALASFREVAPVWNQSPDRKGPACQAACAALQYVYDSGSVYVPGDANFSNFTGSYWSDSQQHVSPRCIFKPSKAADVSAVVLLSRLTQCPFAAKSGGHAAMVGASSIGGGITISLSNLNGISLNQDKSVASIGPGNVWGRVYESLAKSGLTVIGGRLSNIGVGGLTTGGGISYFSPRYGWACDNVESFDVVTASGTVVRASATEYPDLYWALRGGGNNFGHVVNFNLKTVPLPNGQIWGGQKTYMESDFRGLDEAFAYAAANAAQDIDAGLYVVYVHANGMNLGLPVLYHADVINGSQSPSGTRVLTEWATETMQDSPNGKRQLFYTLSTKADVEMATFARERFFGTVAEIADVPGIGPNIVYQAIGAPQLQQMQKNGDNALGLDPADGPVYIMLLAASWTHKEDDARVTAYLSGVLRDIKDEALRRGVFSKYVYMNYASEYQDVISSYGSINKDKLKKIAMKYDPTQVFQKLQPGYFKLNRAPTPGTGYYNI